MDKYQQEVIHDTIHYACNKVKVNSTTTLSEYMDMVENFIFNEEFRRKDMNDIVEALQESEDDRVVHFYPALSNICREIFGMMTLPVPERSCTVFGALLAEIDDESY